MHAVGGGEIAHICRIAADIGYTPVAARSCPHFEDFFFFVVHRGVWLEIVAVGPTVTADHGVHEVLPWLMEPARYAGTDFDEGVIQEQLGHAGSLSRVLRRAISRHAAILAECCSPTHDSRPSHARQFEEAPAISSHPTTRS